MNKHYLPLLKVTLGLLLGIALLTVGTYYFKGLSPLTALKEYFIPELGEVVPQDQVPLTKVFTKIENGNKVTLAELKGEVTLVKFWATWCGPCIVEKPSFDKLTKHFENRKINFLFVSHEDSKKLLAFKQKRGSSLPLYHSSPRGLGAFSGLQIPRTYLLSKSGEIIYAYVGPQKWDDAKIIELIEKNI